MAVSDNTASPFVEQHLLNIWRQLRMLQLLSGYFFVLKTKFYSCYRYFVNINMLKVLNWHCGLVCGSVCGLWVVLNSAASVTDIDIISPLQTPHSRASNEGSRILCKDFTITEKAPTRDLVGATCPRGVGAFFVIVKYSFNLRLKLYRTGRGRAAAL